MVKHEIKVEFKNSEELSKIIEKAYFEEGDMGKIKGNKNYIVVDESEDAHTVLKDLHNATVKITNDIVDGSMRFIIDNSNNEVRISPISTYCIKDEDKYIFY